MKIKFPMALEINSCSQNCGSGSCKLRASGDHGRRKPRGTHTAEPMVQGSNLQGEAVNKQEEMLMFQIHIWALTETPG